MRALLSILSTFALISTSCASVLVSGFGSYTNGNLVGQSSPQGGTWTEFGATTPALTVSSGTVTIDNSNGQDASIAFSSVTSGSLYYAFDLVVTGANAGQYFASFATDAAAATQGGRMYAKSGGAGIFSLAVARNGSGSGIVYGGSLNLDTTYRVVLSYQNIGTASVLANIYVNPTNYANQASNSVYTTHAVGSGLASIGAFGFWQNSSANPDALVSNLVVGTTFADMAPIPEPSTFGLAALGLVAFAVRRRMQV